MSDPARSSSGQLVWDGPTRAMHWLLAVLIAACWWTGTRNELEYHLYCGYGALWIVLLRLYWGFVGSSTARFRNFVRGPKAIAAYLVTLHKRVSAPAYGHNPLGALSVIIMLVMVLAVVTTGLFAVDVDGLFSGPLSSYVSFHAGRQTAHLHYKLFTWLLAAVALHLLAVFFYYAYKKQNLIAPMITGMHSGGAQDGHDLDVAPLWRLVAGMLIAAVFVWTISIGFYF